jgi:hypothetical protein
VPENLGAIDDLTKYRIVEFLLGRPLGGDADFIARSLGFHSVELTASALGDLVEAGICAEDAERAPGVFRLAYGALTRSEIRQLRASRANGGADSTLLRTLATRSLRGARERARKDVKRHA